MSAHETIFVSFANRNLDFPVILLYIKNRTKQENLLQNKNINE